MNAIILFITFLSAALTTAQDNMPATVYFTPYKYENCTMNLNISTDNYPDSFAVTTGRCYNSSYAFTSYVQMTNFEPTIPCALTIWSGTNCTGETLPAARFSKCFNCTSDMEGPGQSFVLNCGP